MAQLELFDLSGPETGPEAEAESAGICPNRPGFDLSAAEIGAETRCNGFAGGKW